MVMPGPYVPLGCTVNKMGHEELKKAFREHSWTLQSCLVAVDSVRDKQAKRIQIHVLSARPSDSLESIAGSALLQM